MVLKLSEKRIFGNFEDINKSKSVKAVYIYACERSRYALSENIIVFYALCYYFGDFRVWSRIILVNFFWVSIFFDILIASISWMMAQIHISHTIFLESVMRTFRCIYEHFFNRISFNAKFSTKLQKNYFFW